MKFGDTVVSGASFTNPATGFAAFLLCFAHLPHHGACGQSFKRRLASAPKAAIATACRAASFNP